MNKYRFTAKAAEYDKLNANSRS